MLPKRPLPISPLPVALVSLVSLSLLGAVGNAAKDELKLKSVAAFAKCADQYDDGAGICLEALERFVKAQPAQAFAAGKAVRAKINHAAAMPYFATALAKKATKAECSDPDLHMALLGGLAMPPGDAASTSARDIVFDKCWNETQTSVLAALARAGSGSFFAENLCPKLSERNLANPACDTRPPASHAAAGEPKRKPGEEKAIQPDGAPRVYRTPGGEGIAW